MRRKFASSNELGKRRHGRLKASNLACRLDNHQHNSCLSYLFDIGSTFSVLRFMETFVEVHRAEFPQTKDLLQVLHIS